MGGDIRQELSKALDIQLRPVGNIQQLFNRYKAHLDGHIYKSPLPEEVHFIAENLPYLIKLENPDPSGQFDSVPAKASIVVPMLEAGIFDETGYTYDETRSNALFNIPELITAPNCIHINLRNHERRGDGGIKGDYVYVRYYGNKKRKVAFTLTHSRLGIIVPSTSFWTYAKWVAECTQMPAVYVRPGSTCTCSGKEKTR